MNDSFKFAIQREAGRVAEAKERLIRQVENQVLSTLLKHNGSAKLFKKASHDLTKAVGPISSSILFDGKIIVHASVEGERGLGEMNLEVPISNSEANMQEEALIMDQIRSAMEAHQEDKNLAEKEAELTLEADLGSFELKEDGTPYLHVFHPALGHELGVISRTEYNAGDKEALLKGILENKFAPENKATLSFVGSFQEPTISAFAAPVEEKTEEVKVEAAPVGVMCPDCGKPSYDCECPVTHEMPLAMQEDSFRQAMETEQQKINARKEKLVSKIATAFVPHVYSLLRSSPKIDTISTEGLKFTKESGFSGLIEVVATFDDNGLRVVRVPVNVEADEVKLPKKEVVSDLLSKAPDMQSEVEEAIAKEVMAQLDHVDAVEQETEQIVESILHPVEEVPVEAAKEPEAEITKTAADIGGTQFFGPEETLYINKHLLNLPDLEEGDVVLVDGLHWELVSKSHNQLSKGEDDGSLWTFKRVPGQSKDKPKAEVNY